MSSLDVAFCANSLQFIISIKMVMYDCRSSTSRHLFKAKNLDIGYCKGKCSAIQLYWHPLYQCFCMELQLTFSFLLNLVQKRFMLQCKIYLRKVPPMYNIFCVIGLILSIFSLTHLQKKRDMNDRRTISQSHLFELCEDSFFFKPFLKSTPWVTLYRGQDGYYSISSDMS